MALQVFYMAAIGFLRNHCIALVKEIKVNAVELAYLNRVLADFIEVSIQRVAQTGTMFFSYRLTTEELKRNTRRQRLHDSAIHEVILFFENENLEVNYNNNFGTFDILLNLGHCRLNRQQASDLSTAISYFQQNNG